MDEQQANSVIITNRPLVRKWLMRWFQSSQRDLPWRTSRDPYAIWVSEVMLQQTQVKTVIPYFLRFVNRFPTIRDLAQADEQDVLRVWEGLGYYRRARHMHQAAQELVIRHRGVFPKRPEELSQLPGFGRYTVGAVLSQAFDQCLPVVDANVARVLCRLFAWQSELESKETQDWLWETARTLLPKQHPGDFNQALMELGQTICRPGRPDCLLCPLRDLCQGNARGKASVLPRRRAKSRQEEVCENSVIIRKAKLVMLCQRPNDALRWANMWEFPTVPEQRECKPLLDKPIQELTGCAVRNLTPLGSINYGITRFKVTLNVHEAYYKTGRIHRQHYQHLLWVKPQQLDDFPLSIPHRRLAKRWAMS